jgi:hypothetical protein
VADADSRLLAGPRLTPERIGLPDQARELRKRITLGSLRCAMIAAAVVIVGGERSVLISISHCDVASPSGKEPARLF